MTLILLTIRLALAASDPYAAQELCADEVCASEAESQVGEFGDADGIPTDDECGQF